MHAVLGEREELTYSARLWQTGTEKNSPTMLDCGRQAQRSTHLQCSIAADRHREAIDDFG